MAVPNDTRGWVMTVVSGIACIIGASVICVDLIICYIPGKKNFRIQESNVFLAASLSLSFGVMLFTSLYGMLPSSKKYLINGGMTPSQAAWLLIGCFVAGFIGIQAASRVLHSFVPSHVVDCDHSHSESHSHEGTHHHSISHSHGGHERGRHSHKQVGGLNGHASESTPLLHPDDGNGRSQPKRTASHRRDHTPGNSNSTSLHTSSTPGRRPSMMEVGGRVMSFVKDTKSNCDEGGPCFGYSDPCGQECFKHMFKSSANSSRSSTFLRTSTANRKVSGPAVGVLEEEEDGETENSDAHAHSPSRVTRAYSRDEEACHSDDDDSEDLEAQHHHHVPKNAFLSIGLQTSFAIALHKLPEGFITYATNHANPALGFSVFMALFIHNITEGFAMALPLYLALGNRLKAMLWASLLGGISQPFGAAIAAIWFKAAGDGGHQPGEKIYGCMFGITAGIMTSVALQLFVESLSLNHNRNLCIFSALVGMSIMGCSNALTA